MADWKKAVRELENENKNHTEYGVVEKHDMYNGLADKIIDGHWDKQDMKWKVEYAEEILKEKRNRRKKEDIW